MRRRRRWLVVVVACGGVVRVGVGKVRSVGGVGWWLCVVVCGVAGVCVDWWERGEARKWRGRRREKVGVGVGVAWLLGCLVAWLLGCSVAWLRGCLCVIVYDCV